MNLESIRMALRGMFANRMRSALTMLGVLIGVGAVIILVAVGSGSAAKARQSLEALGSNTLTVSAGGFGAGNRGGPQSRGISLTDNDVTALSDKTQLPDASAVVPITTASASTSASYNGASTTPGSFIGTTPEYSKVRNAPVQAGRFLNADDVTNHNEVMVIGVSFAKNLLGANANPNALLNEQVQLGSQSLTVIGILKSKGSNGFQDQDDIVLLPQTVVRDFYTGNTGSVSQVIVQAANAKATTNVEAEITALLQSRHTGATATSFRVLNQASLLSTQADSNRTFTVLLGSVAAISLLVGGIGVMNIMLVTVTERTREIGIRKAIGARTANIVSQFLTEAVLLSLLGGLLGVAFGIGGSHFTIVGVKPVVETFSVVLAIGVSLAVGLFFGIYPASRAAKLRPIDALRHE
jgi:putative ABC transport system permease protein